jgi:hypothetical protein
MEDLAEHEELMRQQSLQFVSAHLDGLEDEALSVIKAHLVAESLLYQIIEKFVPNPSALNDARLSFPQLLSVIQAFRYIPSEQWIWNSLRKLNALRNEYAHRLSSDKLENRRRDFIQSTEPWVTPPDGAVGLLHFKFVLIILCGQLSNVCYGGTVAGPSE